VCGRAAVSSLIITVMVLMLGCGTKPRPAPDGPVRERQPLLDFSGSWEVDFSASDSVPRQISANLRQWQRDMERRARTPSRSGPLTLNLGGRSPEAVLALADMAELITAPELLQILQDTSSVRVRRENSFALVCQLTREPPVVTNTPFGREACTWDGRELLFRVALPEGLVIEHQLLLAENRNTLALTTEVSSSRVREPLRVRKVYRRYDPTAQGFRCTETLSKGRVCTTEAPPKP
jgi:hypothetical protein